MLAESALCCSVAKLPIADQAPCLVPKLTNSHCVGFWLTMCSKVDALQDVGSLGQVCRALARLVKLFGKQRWCSVLLMVLAGELLIPSRAPTCGLTSSCAWMSMAELTCRIDQVLTIH